MVNYIKEPKEYSLIEWFEKFKNTISAGKKTNDKITVYAYSDTLDDDFIITDYAKKNNLRRMYNFPCEGVTDIERC